MTKRLYVGGLSYATTDEGLKNLFSQSGQVASATVVTDQQTGQSKGFGFVEMDTNAEAVQAVNTLNETVFEGRTLTVIVSQAQEEPGVA